MRVIVCGGSHDRHAHILSNTQDLMKEKAGLEEQLATSRKEKAAVDEQLTETFFSFEQMKTEWGSKESGYCLQLEQYVPSKPLLLSSWVDDDRRR